MAPKSESSKQRAEHKTCSPVHVGILFRTGGMNRRPQNQQTCARYGSIYDEPWAPTSARSTSHSAFLSPSMVSRARFPGRLRSDLRRRPV